MADVTWGVRIHNGMVFLYRDRGGGIRDVISYRYTKENFFPPIVYNEDNPDPVPGEGGHECLDDALAVMRRWMDEF